MRQGVKTECGRGGDTTIEGVPCQGEAEEVKDRGGGGDARETKQEEA